MKSSGWRVKIRIEVDEQVSRGRRNEPGEEAGHEGNGIAGELQVSFLTRQFSAG